MSIARRTMREVVEELRRERAEALLELQEFDHAMAMMQRHIMALHGAIHQLYAGMAAFAAADAGWQAAELHELIERAGLMSEVSEQIAAAFEQFYSGVKGWGACATDNGGTTDP